MSWHGSARTRAASREAASGSTPSGVSVSSRACSRQGDETRCMAMLDPGERWAVTSAHSKRVSSGTAGGFEREREREIRRKHDAQRPPLPIRNAPTDLATSSRQLLGTHVDPDSQPHAPRRPTSSRSAVIHISNPLSTHTTSFRSAATCRPTRRTRRATAAWGPSSRTRRSVDHVRHVPLL